MRRWRQRENPFVRTRENPVPSRSRRQESARQQVVHEGRERTMHSRQRQRCSRRTLPRARHSNLWLTPCSLKVASFSDPRSYWDEEFHLIIIGCASSRG